MKLSENVVNINGRVFTLINDELYEKKYDMDINGLGSLGRFRFKKIFKGLAKTVGGKLLGKFIPYAGIALTAYSALSKKKKKKGGGQAQPVYQPDGNVQSQNQAQAQASQLPPSNPLEYQSQSYETGTSPNLLLIGGGVLLLILLMQKNGTRTR